MGGEWFWEIQKLWAGRNFSCATAGGMRSSPETFAACLEVKMIFIPKPGGSCYDQAKLFRPISLSSFFLKILERLIDRYVRDNAFHDIVRYLEGAFHHKISVLLCLLISKKYLKTPLSKILNPLFL